MREVNGIKLSAFCLCRDQCIWTVYMHLEHHVNSSKFKFLVILCDFSPLADYKEMDGGEKFVNISKLPLISGDKSQSLHSAVVVMSPASFWTRHLNLSDNLKFLFFSSFSASLVFSCLPHLAGL